MCRCSDETVRRIPLKKHQSCCKRRLHQSATIHLAKFFCSKPPGLALPSETLGARTSSNTDMYHGSILMRVYARDFICVHKRLSCLYSFTKKQVPR